MHCQCPVSILGLMRWIVGALILTVVGYLLRRLLWKELPKQQTPPGLAALGTARRLVYDGFAPEIEARIAMLGISLNDAFEERDAGRFDIAWRLVRLSASEWYGVEKIDYRAPEYSDQAPARGPVYGHATQYSHPPFPLQTHGRLRARARDARAIRFQLAAPLPASVTPAESRRRRS